MAVVNTNVNATVAQNALVRNERQMNTAMERLSTGQRINGAKDDAAGLAISSRMTSQIKGLEMGVRNANDAISMIQTADGALVEVSNMLQRMRELALQSANGTTTESDRNYLNTEYQNLQAEIERIADATQFNGKTILHGDADAAGDSTVKFQVGANGGQTIEVDFGDISASGQATFTALSAGANTGGFISAQTTASAITTASTAVVKIDSAITTVNSQRATFGAAVNQLSKVAGAAFNIHPLDLDMPTADFTQGPAMATMSPSISPGRKR